MDRELRERKIRYAMYPALTIALYAVFDYLAQNYGVALGGGDHSWKVRPILQTLLWIFVPMFVFAMLGLKIAEVTDTDHRRRLFMLLEGILLAVPVVLIIWTVVVIVGQLKIGN